MIPVAVPYKTTSAFEKIVSLKKEIQIVQGGKGSSKTISILMLFILLAVSVRQNLILSVVAESLPNLKSGALRDFEKILKAWGLFHSFKINKTDRTYQYGSNMIEFFSVDAEYSRLGSRRSHLYVNEGDAIKFNTFIELQGRTSEFTIIDFNPRRKFWAHKELIGQPNVDFIILNFTHNEYIPPNEKKSILWYKKKADEGSKFFLNKWRVLGLGLLGITEGVIFENWDKADAIPEEATYQGGCIDWGFANDPATVTKIYKYNGKIYCLESLYRRGLLNSQIAAHIKADRRKIGERFVNELFNGIIIADGSEPKSIAELRTYGINITKAKDKRINSGLEIMQEFDFMLVGKNLIEEFENYSEKTNRSGESMGEPVDDWNHCIDPIRYFCVDKLSRSATNGNTLKFIK